MQNSLKCINLHEQGWLWLIVRPYYIEFSIVIQASVLIVAWIIKIDIQTMIKNTFTLVSQCPQLAQAASYLMFPAGVKSVKRLRLPLCSKWPQGGDATHPPIRWPEEIWKRPAMPQRKCTLNHSVWEFRAPMIMQTCAAVHVVAPFSFHCVAKQFCCCLTVQLLEKVQRYKGIDLHMMLLTGPFQGLPWLSEKSTCLKKQKWYVRRQICWQIDENRLDLIEHSTFCEEQVDEETETS